MPRSRLKTQRSTCAAFDRNVDHVWHAASIDNSPSNLSVLCSIRSATLPIPMPRTNPAQCPTSPSSPCSVLVAQARARARMHARTRIRSYFSLPVEPATFANIPTSLNNSGPVANLFWFSKLVDVAPRLDTRYTYAEDRTLSAYYKRITRAKTSTPPTPDPARPLQINDASLVMCPLICRTCLSRHCQGLSEYGL